MFYPDMAFFSSENRERKRAVAATTLKKTTIWIWTGLLMNRGFDQAYPDSESGTRIRAACLTGDKDYKSLSILITG